VFTTCHLGGCRVFLYVFRHMAKPKANNPGQFLDSRGRVTIERRGMPRENRITGDAYHALRTWSWPAVTAAIFVLFLVVNICFAITLWIGHAHIANADGGFADYFWFSVETMATIGYGAMAPLDAFAHAVVTVESFVGILVGALVTGIFFSRFATPSARLVFSNTAIFGTHDRLPALMFRMANARRTAIVEANIKVYMSQNETLSDGEHVRRVYDLPMRRNTSPLFALSWTAYHMIDPASPFYYVTPELAKQRSMQLIVTFTGIDDQLASTVHSRMTYGFDSFRFDERFVDIFENDPSTGNRFLNMALFHTTVHVDTPRVSSSTT
jgi:inward rectifier potassium channel